jgi:hypothetical protein
MCAIQALPEPERTSRRGGAYLPEAGLVPDLRALDFETNLRPTLHVWQIVYGSDIDRPSFKLACRSCPSIREQLRNTKFYKYGIIRAKI